MKQKWGGLEESNKIMDIPLLIEGGNDSTEVCEGGNDSIEVYDE